MIHAVGSESAQCKLARTTIDKWKSKKKPVEKKRTMGKKGLQRDEDDQSDRSVRARESDQKENGRE